MGLQNFLKVFFGNTEYEQNFKEVLQEEIKKGNITKADAAQLIQSRNNIKLEAKEMDKKQLSSISLEDGTTVSFEEAKAKKEELERKKREKASIQKASLENSINVKNQNDKKQKEAVKNSRDIQKNKLGIDRNKMIKEMEKDEIREKQTKDLERDGKY